MALRMRTQTQTQPEVEFKPPLIPTDPNVHSRPLGWHSYYRCKRVGKNKCRIHGSSSARASAFASTATSRSADAGTDADADNDHSNDDDNGPSGRGLSFVIACDDGHVLGSFNLGYHLDWLCYQKRMK